MKRQRTMWIVYAAAAALLTAGASAQERPSPLSVTQLARRADFVFVGDTVSAGSAWNASHTMIFTAVQQRVVDDLLFKGSLPSGQIGWRQPGGQVGNIKTVVFDGPVFKPGERALLFLIAPERMGIVPTVEGLLGKVSVLFDPRQTPYVVLWRSGGDLFVAPPARGAVEKVILTLPQLREELTSRMKTEVR